MKGKRILVTGGSGFIGTNLVESLKENKVVVFDKTGGNDILDVKKINEATKGMNYVFHLAALTSINESIVNPKETIKTNMIGTLNVFNACLKNNIKKVVFASSAAVYGEPDYSPIDEEHKIKTTNPYGISKNFGENLLKKLNEENGLESVSLRYFNVYGPNSDAQTSVIPIFISLALKNKDVVIFGNGESTRDFIYIEDVTRANVIAMEKNVSGIFNVCSGNGVDMKSLAEKIIELSDSKSNIVFSENRVGDIDHSLGSPKLAMKKLGFKTSYDLETGLKKTIDWFKTKQELS